MADLRAETPTWTETAEEAERRLERYGLILMLCRQLELLHVTDDQKDPDHESFERAVDTLAWLRDRCESSLRTYRFMARAEER